MSEKFNIYIDYGAEKLRQLKEYRETAEKVKMLAEKQLGNVEVYVFGSVIENKATASSDIDILIVTQNDVQKEEAYNLKAYIHKVIEAPVELHITSKDNFEKWYK